jgi:hypothetical protein
MRGSVSLPGSGGESEALLGRIALNSGDYFFRPVVYEIMAASSTRFPCFDIRCRNRSSPCCVFNPSEEGARTRCEVRMPSYVTNASACHRIPGGHARVTPARALLTDLRGRRSGVRCVLSVCRAEALVAELLGLLSGAARGRAGRRDAAELRQKGPRRAACASQRRWRGPTPAGPASPAGSAACRTPSCLGRARSPPWLGRP